MRLPIETLPRSEGQVPPRAAFWLLDQPIQRVTVTGRLQRIEAEKGNEGWDRPVEQWPRAEGGGLTPVFDDLELDDLLAEPEPSPSNAG